MVRCEWREIGAMVYDIIDSLIDILANEAGLSEVQSYQKVIGVPPQAGLGIGIGCDKIIYCSNTRDSDKAKANILVYIYADNPEPELAEAKLHAVAETVRYCINENSGLAGQLLSCSVDYIEFPDAGASGTALWHRAIMHLNAKYMAGRKRALLAVEAVETINNDTDEID